MIYNYWVCSKNNNYWLNPFNFLFFFKYAELKEYSTSSAFIHKRKLNQ